MAHRAVVDFMFDRRTLLMHLVFFVVKIIAGRSAISLLILGDTGASRKKHAEVVGPVSSLFGWTSCKGHYHRHEKGGSYKSSLTTSLCVFRYISI